MHSVSEPTELMTVPPASTPFDLATMKIVLVIPAQWLTSTLS